ncbi:MAG: extracellular solute-binding protein [Actinomycetota bacterium]|nr:extracellular solute-binding protein [Actinomycetota bacterium]
MHRRGTHRGTARRLRAALALLMAMALIAAACGDDDDDTAEASGDGEAPSAQADSDEDADEGDGASEEAAGDEADGAEPVTIDWWHIQNNDPGLADWQAMADEFMEMNPHVTIEINPLENEAFKAALQTNLQAGDPPDLFQSWGGGGLRAQVEAGLVQDITDATSGWIDRLNPSVVELYQVDGVQYGVPFDAGMVGFWYNQELFDEAGIDAPPETWDELLGDVQTLKDAGITPIALGAGDKWPAHFYYSYLMLRIGGGDLMEEIAADGDFSRPEVIEAGEELQRLIDLEPFQAGFLAAPWDGADGEAGSMGSGAAAMDLMGQWAPGTFRNAGADGEDLPFELGWFPFPLVEGGEGVITDAFGGANGFAVGIDAPPEAVEFLEFITNEDNASTWGENSGLPVTDGAQDSVTDPNQQQVLAGLEEATFVQLYLDQFFSAELGAAINDAVQTLFAGSASPEEVAEAITSAAASAG